MKFIIKITDTFTTFIAALLISPFVIIYFFSLLTIARLKNKKQIAKIDHKSRNLLRLVPANLDDVMRKGVLWMLNNTDENGYFGHVYTVHYPAAKSQKILFNEKHTIIEVGKIVVFLKPFGFNFLYLFLNGIYFLITIFHLRHFVKKNIDIIRGYDPDHMGLAALILSRLTGVVFCVSIHADHDKRYKITLGESVYKLFDSKIISDLVRRLTLSNSHLVLVIRESLKQYASKHGAKPQVIRVIPHGIDFDEFEKTVDISFKNKWKEGNKKVVVFAGRLYPENYITDMVKIAAEVKKKIPSILFVLLGDGVEREKTELLSKEMDLSKNVLFLGYQPREKVIAFRKIADVNLCLMGGFSLIEAAASGRPVISYDVEWHYELIRNGVTGYLIKEHDIAEAAEAIVTIDSNPDLASRIGENARRLAIENYSIEKSSQIKRNCYDALARMRANY